MSGGPGWRSGTSRRSQGATTHRLLAISDLHLGGDLRRGLSHTQPPAQDAPLVAMLDHHAPGPPAGHPWRLVIAGDMIDFIGMNIVPDPNEVVPFTVAPHEQTGGLGPHAAPAVWKLQRVVQRHRRFIRRLARFVADGHSLVILAGNHDQEWCLPEVKRVFVEALEQALHDTDAGGTDLRPRVSFRDWFFLEPGRVYLEHGHRYDEYCTPPDPPGAAGPLREPISTLALRWFGNRHEALDVNAADIWTLTDYLRWALRGGRFIRAITDYALMAVRVLAFTARTSAGTFGRTVRRLWKEGRRLHDEERGARLHQALREVCDDHRRLALELSALLRPPAGESVVAVAQMLFVDRLLLAAAAGSLSLACVVASGDRGVRATLLVATLALAWSANRWLARARLVDSHPKLWRVAHRLAVLFHVELVVMGHSHRPVDAELAEGARYINLGSWLPSPQAAGGSFPHLVVDDSGARLLRWPMNGDQPDSDPASPSCQFQPSVVGNMKSPFAGRSGTDNSTTLSLP